MRLYTLSKRHFVLVFVVFFICFGLTVFVGIEGKSVCQSFFLLHPYIAGSVQPAQLCRLTPARLQRERRCAFSLSPQGRGWSYPVTCLFVGHSRQTG